MMAPVATCPQIWLCTHVDTARSTGIRELRGELADEGTVEDAALRAEQDDQVFPDEVDTPEGVPARQRFDKYRGLKSFRYVLPIIRHHHEKMNGTGYPDGLKGDEIPLTARILTIVGVKVRALRVTYVGELGWELHVPRAGMEKVFDALMKAGEPLGKHFRKVRLDDGQHARSARPAGSRREQPLSLPAPTRGRKPPWE